MISIPKYNEKYLVTLPSVLVKGILTGSTYPELSGKAHIVSTSGYVCEINFSGTIFIFGKKNSVVASLYHTDRPSEVLYDATGEWNAELTFTDRRTGKVVEKVDTNTLKPSQIQVPELSQQDPWESRRAWEGVIQAVRDGDMQGIATQKSKLEEAQRKMKARRLANDEEWQPKFFTAEEANPEFEQLATVIGEDFGYGNTRGAWKFDHEKAKCSTRPFYPDSTPYG